MILVVVFLALVLIRMVVMELFLLLILSVGPSCPACGCEAILVRSPRPLRRIRWLERRWCISCEWQDLLRCGPRTRVEAAVAATEQPRPA